MTAISNAIGSLTNGSYCTDVRLSTYSIMMYAHFQLVKQTSKYNISWQ